VAGTTAAAGSMGRARNPPAPSSPSRGLLFCQVQERAFNRLYYLSANIVQTVKGPLLYLTAGSEVYETTRGEGGGAWSGTRREGDGCFRESGGAGVAGGGVTGA